MRPRLSPRRAFECVSVCLLACLALLASPARGGVDVPVESEADYVVLLDAIRASEYTRQGYLEGNANPRMVAAVAGLWAFSEANPLATPEQLAAFVGAYDAELSQAVVGDERLAGTGAVLAALTGTRVASDGALSGTDTRVGRRAMELLGVELPGLESFERSRLRMSRFDAGSVRRWIHQDRTADVLTGVLAGVTPGGERVEGLAAAGAAYLESLGYTPMLGMVDPAQVEVNAGLAGLPDYAGFVAIRDDAGAHTTLEGEVFGRIDAIQADAEAMLDDIGVAEIPEDLGLDSVGLFAAAGDPGHPDHAAAVQFLEGRRQAVIDAFRETSDDRAAVFARTMLLSQSSYPDVRYVAGSTRSFAGMQLQINNDLAVAQQSLGIVGSLAELGAAYATGNVFGGIVATADTVSGILGLADLLGDGPPSADEQIFTQIAELRQQVEDMRVQMHERFDIVDAKLDVIFSTMVAAFGMIQDGINQLLADIASVRGSLDRIEAALFGFAQNVLLVDLTLQTDAVLDYRAKTGSDLSYNDFSPSFVGGASGLTTFATFTAQTSAFAGPEDGQAMSLTIDNAAELLSGDAVVSRLLNDFRRVPSGLVTTGGVPVAGPILSGRVAAPAPWAQAGASYAQLARENPWYFAYMLRNQQDASGGNSPQVDQIIAQGERIVSLAEATRGRDDLFNALLGRASDGIAGTQQAIDDLIDAELAARGWMNATQRVDPWGELGQPATRLVTTIDRLNLSGIGDTFTVVPYVDQLPERGWEMSISDNRTGGSAGVSRSALASRNALDWKHRRTSTPRPLVHIDPGSPNAWDGYDFEIEVEMRIDGDRRSRRTIGAVVEINDPFDNGWGPLEEPWDFENTVTFAQFSHSAWIYWQGGNARLGLDLSDGDLTGEVYDSGDVFITDDQGWGFPQQHHVETRIRITSDTSDYVYDGYDYFPAQTAYLTGLYADARDDVRAAVSAELVSPGSPVVTQGEALADTVALLDGYLTLGTPHALARSEILRSALRGVPDADGLGFRMGDVIEVIGALSGEDAGALGGARGFDLPTLEEHFAQRIAGVGAEVGLALGGDDAAFPYVELVLAELRDLRGHAFDLAVDDTYLAQGWVSVDAAAGLMANDIGQAGRIDNEDLMVDLAYFGMPGHTAPAHGTVTVFADGSFEYVAEPGFEGVDSFDYRLVAQVGDPSNPVGDPNVYSEPATVVVRVGASGCVADVTGDGLLNFFDVAAYIGLFSDGDPAADLTGDGSLNFFDVSAYVGLFNAGCP